jgi:hypothetical protein
VRLLVPRQRFKTLLAHQARLLKLDLVFTLCGVGRSALGSSGELLPDSPSWLRKALACSGEYHTRQKIPERSTAKMMSVQYA